MRLQHPYYQPDPARCDDVTRARQNSSATFRAAWALRRCLQKSSSRLLAWIHRRARMCSAPGLPQNIPDCLHRAPITVLHPASTTPEPIKKPRRRLALQKGGDSVPITRLDAAL
jgi:hypothetical protein